MKILNNKIKDYINNFESNNLINNENHEKFIIRYNILINESKNKIRPLTFFNYNNDSCWADSILFIGKNILFVNNEANFNNWKIDKIFLSFLEDVCHIQMKKY